jgi:predicted phosphoribosyltransferase
MNLSTRSEAGRQLASVLAPTLADLPAILALSPGGARVAFEVAQALAAPLDMVHARKLEVPGRCRSTFGAVTPGTVRVSRPVMKRLALPKRYLKNLIQHEEHEAELDERSHRGHAGHLDLSGRLAILVDDGSAEPLVVSAAIASLRTRGAARVFFAVPYLSAELNLAVSGEVDRLVTLSEPDDLHTPILCDECFAQTTWEDVQRMVRLSRQGDLVPA